MRHQRVIPAPDMPGNVAVPTKNLDNGTRDPIVILDEQHPHGSHPRGAQPVARRTLTSG